jgi:hypothetical protein
MQECVIIALRNVIARTSSTQLNSTRLDSRQAKSSQVKLNLVQWRHAISQATLSLTNCVGVPSLYFSCMYRFMRTFYLCYGLYSRLCRGEKQISKDEDKDVDKEDAAKLATEVRSSEVNALCDDIGGQCGSQVKRICERRENRARERRERRAVS